MSDADDIRGAIRTELRTASMPVAFRVRGVEREKGVLRVSAEPLGKASALDESFEDSDAWWPGPPRGTAEVLSVVPEREQVNLQYASGRPPVDGLLMLYPHRYLQALLDLWLQPSLTERALAWLHAEPARRAATLVSPPFDWLRRRQREAFGLIGASDSFLWGPPGTGKTTTLGAMIAEHLLRQPDAKILLTSTTNWAVDQALVAVDERLEELAQKGDKRAAAARRLCKRVGANFIAAHYDGRQHLLPEIPATLLRELQVLQESPPDPENVQAYQQWKRRKEEIRREIQNRALTGARVAAMTTTRAVYSFERMQEANFTQLAIDEASQVGLAHAMMLSLLAPSRLFAGDPKQLAPIVMSDGENARLWLGRSAFVKIPHGTDGATVMLDEQSRMAAPICQVVSETFYGGKLRVAEDCKREPAWIRVREPLGVGERGSRNTYVVPLGDAATFSKKYGGNIDYESANLICDLVEDLVPLVGEQSILILTPYRAQRAFLRAMLKARHRRRVRVSTVHRAQGTEENTVIFDPVDATNSFLNNEDLGPRLLNVSISRAQARFFLMLSPKNRTNKLLQRVAWIIESAGSKSKAVPIEDLPLDRDFPSGVVGRDVRDKRGEGRIVDVGSDYVAVQYFRSGEVVKKRIAILVQRAVEREAGFFPKGTHRSTAVSLLEVLRRVSSCGETPAKQLNSLLSDPITGREAEILRSTWSRSLDDILEALRDKPIGTGFQVGENRKAATPESEQAVSDVGVWFDWEVVKKSRANHGLQRRAAKEWSYLRSRGAGRKCESCGELVKWIFHEDQKTVEAGWLGVCDACNLQAGFISTADH